MANLPETPVWETGIYQLEETDPVQGGPNGIDNQQGKQLANRTAWLKSQVETLGTGKQPLDATLTAIAALNGVADRIAYFTGPDTVALTPLTAFIRTLLDDGDASAARSTLGAISQTQLDAAISALVNSSPATLDTLNELADALGNDANFATTVTNALAAKAPLASPVFTGDPKAPTPAQFDNDTSLATTAFVQRALGNFQGLVGASTPVALTPADAGKRIVASNTTVTLPSTATLAIGSVFSVFAYGPNGVTVAGVSTDTLTPGGGTAGLTSIFVPTGCECTFVSEAGKWEVSGTGALSYASSFGSSLAASGYQKLPSGLIVQWGSVASSGSADVAVTFPVAFPSAARSLSAISSGTGGGNWSNFNSLTTTGFNVAAWTNTSTRSATQINWIAIGY